MSGVYLTVWDKKAEKSAFLRTTEGGYPHITLAYTGEKLDRDQLTKIASWVLVDWALKTITITGAYVNSFKQSNGTERHDVLLKIAEAADIEQSRNAYLRTKFSHSDTFFYGDPHITHGVYQTREDAERVRDELNRMALPYTVKAHGVTID